MERVDIRNLDEVVNRDYDACWLLVLSDGAENAIRF